MVPNRTICLALLLLAGFVGVSSAKAPAIEQKAAVCKGCHLTDTVQSTSVIPNIWGQSEGYIYLQLRDFKSGARNAPEDAAMRGFAATMSDADMLEIRDGKLEIDPQLDGPLQVRGNLEITSGTGRVVARVTQARLCRCGASANKPFCDGSHVRIGFRSQ